MTDPNNVFRNGVDRHVGPYQACGTPGPEPRPGPPLATGSHSRRKYGPGPRRKSDKATGRTHTYTLHDHQLHQTAVLRSKRLSKSINIVQVNICGSFEKKKVILANLFSTQKIHVALLQETQHKQETNLHIAGYTPYPCNCNNCRGIITYIRNDVDGDVTHLPRAQPTDVQKVYIWHAEKKYTIYNVYNPPTASLNLPDIQETVFHNTILAGDFNGHSPQWGYSGYNRTGHIIEELCGSTNLSVLQNKDTKPTLLHRRHLSLTRPDLTIPSADLTDTCYIETLDDIGSDHRPTLISLLTPDKTYSNRKPRWNFRKGDRIKYKQVSDQLLGAIDEGLEDVTKLNEEVVTGILKASSQCIPRGSVQHYKPYWCPEIEKAVETRNTARDTLEANTSPTNRTQYNKACAEVKLTVKASKKNKWQETTAGLNLDREGNKAWGLLQNLAGDKRSSNPKPMEDHGTTISSDQKKAEHMNRFFASVSRAAGLTDHEKESIKQLKMQEKAPTVNNSIFEQPFSKNELRQALSKLKSRKAPGPDRIHSEMLLWLGPVGKDVLLRLINLSWKTGELPQIWKNALLMPILKKDKNPAEPRSFRPISLTSCIGKVAERMINRRLYWYLETSGYLGKNQAGFRKGKCTEDQLFRLTQSIQDGFQSKKHTLAVFVDLQQAYDRVWRKGLLMKMSDIGIHGNMYNWIKYFLTNRTIQTKMNDAISSKEVLEEGLPQGSCLSCILFLVYISDLEDVLDIVLALYADDLVLWVTRDDIYHAASDMRTQLRKLEKYCVKWKLKISEPKTVYTIFTKSHKVEKEPISLKINNKEIEKDQNPTYLGMQLDSELTLKNHVENLKTKANRRLKLLKKLSGTDWGSDKRTLRNLYLGYVRSALEYGAALMTTCSKANQGTLDKIQNNALRLINGGMRSTPTAACEIHANVEPLSKRREKAALELYEKTKRTTCDNPNRMMVDNWEPNNRIKQKSVLHNVWEIKDKHHLPEDRRLTNVVLPDIPPHMDFRPPTIKMSIKGNISKKDDPVKILTASLQTIDSYSDNWIHVYTDGSAFRGTSKAGYGVLIHYPDGSAGEFSGACGEHASNYVAEIAAIETALHYIKTFFESFPTRKQSIIIFTDSMSALQGLEQDPSNKEEFKKIVLYTHEIIETYGVEIVMQWIPGHSDIPGNEKADTLAKKGSRQEQPHTETTYETARQIIRSNYKEEWLNEWAMGTTGRALFKHMTTPNVKDELDKLTRKDQSTIFRLRTQHIPLNSHLNRIGAIAEKACPLCDYPDETIEHHLFLCPKLNDIRTKLLPSQRDIHSIIHSIVMLNN